MAKYVIGAGAERARVLLEAKLKFNREFYYLNAAPPSTSRQVRRRAARANNYWGTAWRAGRLQPGWSTKRMARRAALNARD